MKRGRPKKTVEIEREIKTEIKSENIIFHCETYPALSIYNLSVKFVDGIYTTDNKNIIEKLREIIKNNTLPISEVK